MHGWWQYFPHVSVIEVNMHGCLERRQNLKVCNEDPRRLKDSNNKETVEPRFDKELWAHFVQLLSWHAPNVKCIGY